MRTKKGFTLIELLVVIAIIAILAAILFPVFAKAREKARQTGCLNNLKQIGLGMMQYVQDYDETYPGLWNPDATSPYSNGLIGIYYVLQPYVKNTQLFLCPSQSARGIAYYQTFPTSYAFNAKLAWSSLAECVKPASTVAMTDSGSVASSSTGPGPYITENSTPRDGGWILSHPDGASCGHPTYGADQGSGDWVAPSLRHSGRCNVAFADGHAKSMSHSWYYPATPWLFPGIGGD